MCRNTLLHLNAKWRCGSIGWGKNAFMALNTLPCTAFAKSFLSISLFLWVLIDISLLHQNIWLGAKSFWGTSATGLLWNAMLNSWWSAKSTAVVSQDLKKVFLTKFGRMSSQWNQISPICVGRHQKLFLPFPSTYNGWSCFFNTGSFHVKWFKAIYLTMSKIHEIS